MTAQTITIDAETTALTIYDTPLAPRPSPLEWVIPGADDGDLQAIAWQDAKDAWLKSKLRKSGSQHTVTAYSRDWSQFFKWAGKAPWNVSSRDAEAWMHQLEQDGASHSTINRKLAALSSFYEFVSSKYTFIGSDQVERSIYIDGYGNPRPNPFKKPQRHPIDSYNHSTPISADAVKEALKAINPKSLCGSRDMALIITYIYTGRRSSEIAALRWGDLEHDAGRARYYYTWTGKGGKGRTDELPPPAWHAIVNFLKVTGRHETIRPADYIFQPVYGDRAERLPNVSTVDENRPISGSMINRIVKRRFAAVGVDAGQVHTHTLRHTAAHLRYRDGEGEDILAISRFLNHSSVAVTQIYLSKQHRPLDTGWTSVEQLLMF